MEYEAGGFKNVFEKKWKISRLEKHVEVECSELLQAQILNQLKDIGLASEWSM